MKKKSMLIVAILLMSIGFAAISTTLIINGNAKVSENNEDFSVIFTAASIDGKNVYSTAVDETKKTITFTTSELQNVIAPTKVISGHGPTTGETNFETQDKLYLLSNEEIYSDFASSSSAKFDTSLGTSKQLDYYKKQGVTTNNYAGAIKQYNGSNSYCWLRSALSESAYRFLNVNTGDGWFHSMASASNGVSPAFRIA